MWDYSSYMVKAYQMLDISTQNYVIYMCWTTLAEEQITIN